MADDKTLPYDRETSDDWLAQVDQWPWIKLGEDKWKKSGQCPRCGHYMERVVWAEVVFAETLNDLEGLGAERSVRHVDDRVHVECNCASSHSERPEGESGCGPQGLFDGPKEWGR